MFAFPIPSPAAAAASVPSALAQPASQSLKSEENRGADLLKRLIGSNWFEKIFICPAETASQKDQTLNLAHSSSAGWKEERVGGRSSYFGFHSPDFQGREWEGRGNMTRSFSILKPIALRSCLWRSVISYPSKG